MINVMTASMDRLPKGSGNTPQRTIRIPGPEWDAARAAADAEGETLSDVIRAALRRYTARHAKRTAKEVEAIVARSIEQNGDAWRDMYFGQLGYAGPGRWAEA